MIDTNIVLHQVGHEEICVCVSAHGAELIIMVQIDVLESLPASIPIVLPSTTLAETRHRSLPLYNRLQSLLADEDRKVWVFWNEERRETATKVERYRTGVESITTARIDDEDNMGDELDTAETEVPGSAMSRETINDRNDRGK